MAQRACRIHEIIDEDKGLALDLADDVHHFRLVRTRATFVDDGEIRIVEALGQSSCPDHTADVGRHDHQVLVFLLPGIAEQHGRRIHVVDRNIEETLNLIRMQINGQHAIDTGAGNHVGDQLRRDRHAHRARATILTCVSEVRNHRRDARRRRTSACIDHHQQLHQMIVRWRARRLHDEHIATADVLEQLDRDLAVTEPADRCPSERDGQVAADFISERLIGVARKHRHRCTIHQETSRL